MPKLTTLCLQGSVYENSDSTDIFKAINIILSTYPEAVVAGWCPLLTRPVHQEAHSPQAVVNGHHDYRCGVGNELAIVEQTTTVTLERKYNTA